MGAEGSDCGTSCGGQPGKTLAEGKAVPMHGEMGPDGPFSGRSVI